MNRLFLFDSTHHRDPAVNTWLDDHTGDLGDLARRWFGVLRQGGDDVREILHDGHPTACVHRAAFAYVNAFTAHVNVGFFHGAELADPDGLLQGSGKFMRHVKLRPGEPIDAGALTRLIETAYSDMRARLRADQVT